MPTVLSIWLCADSRSVLRHTKTKVACTVFNRSIRMCRQTYSEPVQQLVDSLMQDNVCRMKAHRPAQASCCIFNMQNEDGGVVVLVCSANSRMSHLLSIEMCVMQQYSTHACTGRFCGWQTSTFWVNFMIYLRG